MKRIYAFILFIIMIIYSTQFSNILKIPFFFEHYENHKIENKNISIIDFFTMHYFNGNIIDDDYIEDMQLPFKQIIYNFYFLDEVVFLKLLNSLIIIHVFMILFIIFKKINYKYQYLFNLLKPPKLNI